MKFRRRTSIESSSSSAANNSTARSIAWQASGRPAPRNAVIGVVFVTTLRPSNSMRGIAYTPLAMSIVKVGRKAPTTGYAPAS
jgi:hypothetical protein